MNLGAVLEHLIECDSDRAFLADAIGSAIVDAQIHDERTSSETHVSAILLAACLDLNGDFKGLVPHHDETKG